MKRICVLLAILCVFTFCGLNNSTATKLFSKFQTGVVSFYCSNVSGNLPNATILQNGDGYIIETGIENAIEVANSISNCNGFSIKINKLEEEVESLINSIVIVEQEIVSNIKIIYGYVCGLINSTYINGKKVNIQIAENGDIITIGSPIILGSY